jgi:hypothetical protein
MTTDEIKEMAGHRVVPPWVMKLVGDCLAKEREEFAVHAVDIARRAVKEERKRICKQIAMLHDSLSLASDTTTIRAKETK